jgi:Holliday junction DNA helicase RuvA
MIGALRGTVMKLRENHLVLEVGGVGYKVAVLKELLKRTKEGASLSLATHLAVREDLLDLYGFVHEEELALFEQLLTVSGIGPKSALAVLDIASVETLSSAIASGNASYLTNVSGIGKKTAEKIVLELKDKVTAKQGAGSMPVGDQEALEAMRSLGYSASEARDALRKVPASVEGGSARLKEALRVLGK